MFLAISNFHVPWIDRFRSMFILPTDRCIYLDDQLNDECFFQFRLEAKLNAITCTPLYTFVRYSIIFIYFHFTWLDRCSCYLLTINHVYSHSSIWKWWPHLAQITISALFILITNGIIGGISVYLSLSYNSLNMVMPAYLHRIFDEL